MAFTERKIVSILFADLVGFTALSEALDPEDIATIQDRYFEGVREVIGRYAGRIEKFIGDAAMAVFGVPRIREDDAERAVRAGLAIVNGGRASGGEARAEGGRPARPGRHQHRRGRAHRARARSMESDRGHG